MGNILSRNVEVVNEKVIANGHLWNGKRSNHITENKPVNAIEKYGLDQIASANDQHLFCFIRYIYDYLPEKVHWLTAQRIRLSDVLSKEPHLIQGATRENGFPLYPEYTRLPVHTGLGTFRQSKHWKANEQATRELLQLFANDQHCKNVMLSNGRSMATLAKRQLESEVLDTYSRFSIYMFPDGDEKRIQLLAQSVILIFIFDGKCLVRKIWEENR